VDGPASETVVFRKQPVQSVIAVIMTIQKNRSRSIFLLRSVLILAFLKDSQQGLAESSQLAEQIEQHYLKGSDLLQKGDLQAAERELKRAITLAPQIPEPYYLLAKVSIARGTLDGAESLLLKAIQLKPDFAEAHHTLGGIYLQRQDYGRARDAFQQTLRWKPE
jgi:tetratricopeptide (TPR) repeat protein